MTVRLPPAPSRRASRHAIVVALAVYVPLFGLMLPAVQRRFNTVLYVGVIVLLTTAGLWLARPRRLPTLKGLLPYLMLCLGLIAIAVLHLADGTDTLRTFLGAWSGVFLSLSLVSYVYTFGLARDRRFFDALALLVGVAFTLQFLLSLYESRAGIILAQGKGWLDEDPTVGYLGGNLLESRLVLSAFGVNVAQVLGLQNPLTGLLGQHNYWGTQLPFYNLVFWIQILSGRRRRYWGLAALVMLAAVLNTSRFGLLAVLVTDVVLAYRYAARQRGAVSVLLVLIVAVFVVGYAPELADSVAGYWATTDTLTGRFESYSVLVGAFWDRPGYDILLGSGTTGVSAFLFSVFGRAKSFESQLFATAFQSGLVGVALLVFFVVVTLVRVRRLADPGRVLLALVVVNVLVVSLVSNLVFDYASFAFVTLLYVHIIATWSQGLPPSSAETEIARHPGKGLSV